MDRYKSIIIIITFCLLSSYAFAGNVTIKNNGSFVTVKAIRYKILSAFETVVPKYRDTDSWRILFTHSHEYRLFVGLGQSNMVGFGTAASSISEANAVEIKVVSGVASATSPVVDPAGAGDGIFDSASSGSLWPAFCHQYFTETGQKPIILILGNASSGLHTLYYQPWLSTSWQAAWPDINTALAYLISEGYDFEWRDIIWWQGETDAQSGRSEAQYKADFSTFWGYVTTKYISSYPNLKAGIITLKNITDETFDTPIINALLDIAEGENAYLGCQNPYSGVYNSGLGWHMTLTQYEAIGVTLANNIPE